MGVGKGRKIFLAKDMDKSIQQVQRISKPVWLGNGGHCMDARRAICDWKKQSIQAGMAYENGLAIDYWL